MRQKNYDIEIATLRAELATIRQERQGNPNVNGWLSAVVATSPESLDAVAFSVAGMFIGLPASAGAVALGGQGAAPLQVWGICASAGVALGVVRLAAAAVDLPLIIEGLADKYFDWRDRRDERGALAPHATREAPVYARGEQVGYISLPEATEFKVRTLIIPSVNTATGEREIAVDKVCLFLKSAVASGNWSRDTQDILNKKEHPDVKAYLTGRGYWMIDPPALRRACAILRGGGTNGTERDGTNEGTI